MGEKNKRITRSDCWRSDLSEIRFLIKSVYDVLPSPTNLLIWGKRETPNCQLCARKGSLQHILSSCPKALGDGRYRWCHDQALKIIANEVTKAMRVSNHQPGKKLKQINFVKAGEKIQRKRREKRTCRRRLAIDSGSGDSAEVPQTHSCNIAKTGPYIAL